MYYSEEEIEEWKNEHRETLNALSELGWDWPEEKDVAEISHQLYRQMTADHELAIQMSARTFGVSGTQWTQEATEWEKCFDRNLIIKARQDLMTSCFEKQATVEFIVDLKRRWENQEFSSITPQHIVIGDTYCLNEIGLPNKMEAMQPTTFSRYGTSSLFLDQWKSATKEDIQWVRPQINGERFVLQGSQLVGFKTFDVDKTFPIRVLEYYAGKFYAIYPTIEIMKSYAVRYRGKVVHLEVQPHPKMTIGEFLYHKENYANHKYDGLMLWFKTGEIRVKYHPSAEVEVEGETWEVSFNLEKPFLRRPRPGKPLVSMTKARTWTHAQITYATVMHVFSQTLNSLPYSENPEKNAVVIYASKCAFVTPEGEILLIREPEKRLDFIGGRIEQGESPIDAMLRETEEETGISMTAKEFFYIGSSGETTEHATWISHVFIAWAPREMKNSKYVESFSFIHTFKYMEASSLGRPWQVWLSRHYLFLHDFFSGLGELRSALFLLFGLPQGGIKPEIVCVSEKTLKIIKAPYLIRVKLLRQRQTLKELEREGLIVLPEMLGDVLAGYTCMDSGTIEEQRRWWSDVLEAPKSLSQLRVELRLAGCTWTRKKFDQTIELAIYRQFITKDKSVVYYKRL